MQRISMSKVGLTRLVIDVRGEAIPAGLKLRKTAALELEYNLPKMYAVDEHCRGSVLCSGENARRDPS